MTNEITIYPSSSGGGGLMGPEDEFSAGAQQQGAPAKTMSPMQRLHRLLRGRYWLAATLAIIGAVFGAVFGWSSRTPAYTSTGMMLIEPTNRGMGETSTIVAMYQYYILSQVALVESQANVDAAMHTDEWLNAVKEHPTLATEPVVFQSRLNVAQVKSTFNIRVQFTDPNSKVSVAAVRAVIDCYNRRWGNTDADQRRKTKDWLERNREDYRNKLRQIQASLDHDASTYGSEELGPILEDKRKKATALEEGNNNFVNNLQMLKAQALSNKELQVKNIETFMLRLADVDQGMKNLLEERSKAQTNYNSLTVGYDLGSKHPMVSRALLALETARKECIDYAKQATTRRLNVPQLTPEMVSQLRLWITPEDVAEFEKQAADRKAEVDRAKSELIEISSAHTRMQQNRTDIARLTADINDYDRKITSIEAELALTQRVNILDRGSEPPGPTEDKRKQFAVLGFLAGGLFPIGALLLIGLMDRRYRYSDDTEADLGALPLLGVLPNLPDRLSDPHQAAIASHCVHQIRTRLQINSTGGTRHVWAVTSAAAGDGKSSLVLSLGLSYAACGARTLLIDCDLVGAGLSHRLNITTQTGILDAIASRTLLQYVHSTDAADVAILPAGNAQGHQASLLSPAALRRLIFEAKKHFEIIIIDTGPILGSIEASLVCAEADGVLLCVSRSQKRPAVIKALVQLRSVGARIAGIVFNRANAWDFEQHMSGQSQRAASRNGNGGSPFGPVARAVASSSFKSDQPSEG